MASGEDWLMRPVVEGMTRYEAIHDPSLGLEDFARMNEALDVRNENEARMAKAAEEQP